MARVELTRDAVTELDALILTHSLPPDTRDRIQRSLGPLERFPRVGRELTGRWVGLRFLLGPWRWLLVVYVLLEEEDRAVVVTFQDARSSTAPRAGG